jgi:Zn-dependent protease with chaperone function
VTSASIPYPLALAGWGLVQTVWQAPLVGLAYLAGRHALRRSSPEKRHQLALAALLLMAALPPFTVLLSVREVAGIGGGSPILEGAPPESLASAARAIQGKLPALLSAWLAGVLLVVTYLWSGWRRLSQILVRARQASEAGELAAGLCFRAGVPGTPIILESEEVATPLVTGWRRPVLLLPRGLVEALTAGEMRAVLLHELAHIARRDSAVNLVQRLLEALLWFQPAVWLVSADLRRFREECCDDAAVHAGGRPAVLARALVHLAEFRGGAGRLVVAGSGGELFGRIERLALAARSHRPGDAARPAGATLAAAAMSLSAMAAAGLGARASVGALTSALPVALIQAEDPAGHFTLELVAGRARAATVDGRAVQPDHLVQVGHRLHIDPPDGRASLDIVITSPTAIRWTPRAPSGP